MRKFTLTELSYFHVSASYVRACWDEYIYKYKGTTDKIEKQFLLIAQARAIVCYDRNYVELMNGFNENEELHLG